jgi:hypothetical protein
MNSGSEDERHYGGVEAAISPADVFNEDFDRAQPGWDFAKKHRAAGESPDGHHHAPAVLRSLWIA